MKKTLTVFAVTLLLLLAVGLLCGSISFRAAREMCDLTDDIRSSARQGDFAAAGEECEELLAMWEKKEPLLQLWTVHEDTDDVGVLIDKLRIAAREQNALHTALLCEELYMSIEHLYHRDAPMIKNIF